MEHTAELRGVRYAGSLQQTTSDYYRALTPTLERLVRVAGGCDRTSRAERGDARAGMRARDEEGEAAVPGAGGLWHTGECGIGGDWPLLGLEPADRLYEEVQRRDQKPHTGLAGF